MKSFIIIIVLFFSLQIIAQNTDTFCIKTRYISVKPTEENASLFTFKQKKNKNSLPDVMVRNIYFGGRVKGIDYSDLGSWCELNSKMTASGSFHTKYQFYIEQITPLKNVFGEDSMIMLIEQNLSHKRDDGIIVYDTVYQYIYPSLDTLNVKSSEISGIRIKEDLVFDEKTYSYTFQPVALGFCVQKNADVEIELFWVELEELFDKISQNKKYKWADLLQKKLYQGEVYKTISCDQTLNDDIKSERMNYLKFSNLGDIKFKEGNYSNAVKDYSKAILYDSSFAHIYINRGMSQFYLNNFQGSFEDMNKAIMLGTNSELAYYYRGLAKYTLNDTLGAINDLNQVIFLDSSNVEAFYKRGMIKYFQEDYQHSIDDYNHAIFLSPKNGNYYYRRGLSKMKLDDYHGAIADFNVETKQNSKNANAYYYNGYCNMKLKKYKIAKLYFDLAIILNPNETSYHKERGMNNIYLKDYEGAIKDFNIRLSQDSLDYLSYFNRASAKNKIGDKIEALIDYNRAIQLNPQFKDAYNNRGVIKWDNKDLEGALSDFNKTIEIDPNYVFAYRNRGEVKLQQNDKDGCSDLEQAKKLGLENVEQLILKYCK